LISKGVGVDPSDTETYSVVKGDIKNNIQALPKKYYKHIIIISGTLISNRWLFFGLIKKISI
jgi:hypothetical protein